MNARGITDNGLAELLCLLSTKKGDDYSTTMSWIRPPDPQMLVKQKSICCFSEQISQLPEKKQQREW